MGAASGPPGRRWLGGPPTTTPRAGEDPRPRSRGRDGWPGARWTLAGGARPPARWWRSADRRGRDRGAWWAAGPAGRTWSVVAGKGHENRPRRSPASCTRFLPTANRDELDRRHQRAHAEERPLDDFPLTTGGNRQGRGWSACTNAPNGTEVGSPARSSSTPRKADGPGGSVRGRAPAKRVGRPTTFRRRRRSPRRARSAVLGRSRGAPRRRWLVPAPSTFPGPGRALGAGRRQPTGARGGPCWAGPWPQLGADRGGSAWCRMGPDRGRRDRVVRQERPPKGTLNRRACWPAIGPHGSRPNPVSFQTTRNWGHPWTALAGRPRHNPAPWCLELSAPEPAGAISPALWRGGARPGSVPVLQHVGAGAPPGRVSAFPARRSRRRTKGETGRGHCRPTALAVLQRGTDPLGGPPMGRPGRTPRVVFVGEGRKTRRYGPWDVRPRRPGGGPGFPAGHPPAGDADVRLAVHGARNQGPAKRAHGGPRSRLGTGYVPRPAIRGPPLSQARQVSRRPDGDHHPGPNGRLP